MKIISDKEFEELENIRKILCEDYLKHHNITRKLWLIINKKRSIKWLLKELFNASVEFLKLVFNVKKFILLITILFYASNSYAFVLKDKCYQFYLKSGQVIKTSDKLSVNETSEFYHITGFEDDTKIITIYKVLLKFVRYSGQCSDQEIEVYTK